MQRYRVDVVLALTLPRNILMPFRDDNRDDEWYQADDDHVTEGDVCDVEDPTKRPKED